MSVCPSLCPRLCVCLCVCVCVCVCVHLAELPTASILEEFCRMLQFGSDEAKWSVTDSSSPPRDLHLLGASVHGGLLSSQIHPPPPPPPPPAKVLAVLCPMSTLGPTHLADQPVTGPGPLPAGCPGPPCCRLVGSSRARRCGCCCHAHHRFREMPAGKSLPHRSPAFPLTMTHSHL